MVSYIDLRSFTPRLEWRPKQFPNTAQLQDRIYGEHDARLRVNGRLRESNVDAWLRGRSSSGLPVNSQITVVQVDMGIWSEQSRAVTAAVAAFRPQALRIDHVST